MLDAAHGLLYEPDENIPYVIGSPMFEWTDAQIGGWVGDAPLAFFSRCQLFMVIPIIGTS